MGTTAIAPQSTAAEPLWRRLLCNRWSIAGVLALLLYSLAGFLLAPWLINRQGPRYIEEQFQHRLSLGQVRVNPFLLTCEITDFRLEDAVGEPLLVFDRLLLDLEWETIFRRAWTFAEISLLTPALYLQIDREGELNLARFLARMPVEDAAPAEEAGAAAKPRRMLLKLAQLDNGALHFSDYSGTTPVAATFAPLTIELAEISTLPERSGSHAVIAHFPGRGRLSWEGEASLLPLASRGTLRVENFEPAGLWEFFQNRFALAQPEGTAQLRLDYRFAHAAGETELLIAPLDFTLNDLLLRKRGGERPLLKLAELEATGATFDLARRELRFPAISLRRGELSALTDQAGLLEWQQLYEVAPAAAESESVIAPPTAGAGPVSAESSGGEGPPAAAGAGVAMPWRLEVESFSLEDFALHYSDYSRGAPFELDAEEASLTLAVSAGLGFGPPELRVADLALRLGGISSREALGGQPLWSLAETRLTWGNIDLAERLVGVKSLRLGGGRAEILRSAAGTIRQLEVLGSGAGRPGNHESEPQAASDPAWRLLLDRFELADFNLDYIDQGFTPALEYDLRDLALTAEGIDSAGSAAVKVAARVGVAQGGLVEAQGSVAPSGEEADGRITVSGLNLQPLDPLLREHLLLRLASGELSLEQNLSYRADASGPQLRAAGRAGIDNLLLEERGSGARFLAWRQLAVSALDFSFNPDHLLIGEVQLLEPEAKIIISADREVNLSLIGREQAESPAAEEAAVERQPFPLRVERVRLENGVVDFADFSLLLPFSARIEKLSGAALNISSEPDRPAILQFSGRVDQYGEAKLEGSLAPLDPRHFTDLNVLFRNVTMQPLDPYSATFAGRRIVSGRLDLDLGYKIEAGQLLGDHHLILRDFKLGERVESPQALRLPLDLAIALLTDREGKIDVAVPVRGHIDDPEFSYGHVIWQAVRNLLARIVTAPFRALGAMFGGDSAPPDTIFFAPGQVEPSPPEREKLLRAAELLKERPQLLLTVPAVFAREPDGESLRSLAVRRALVQELGVALPPEGRAEPVAFDQAKTQRALEALAGGSEPVRDFLAAYEAASGREARRVNPALALFGRGSDDLDFYRALFQDLVEKAPMDDGQLAALAEARRDAVIRELIEVAGLAPERLLAGELHEAEAKEPAVVPMSLELGAR